jgi:pimeloyl-ACP methyl ester carboxylesterase
MQVKRGFVEIADGEVHYRQAGQRNGRLPFVMLHPGPTSSQVLVPLMERLGKARWIIAPDVMGMGESDPPAEDNPDMAYFAGATFRFLDALGIDSFDLWGSVTGARCAVEMALIAPERINCMYIELLQQKADDATRKLLEDHHAPKLTFDHHGSHFRTLWALTRDQFLFYPWFQPEAARRRRSGLPSADVLHDKMMELLKSARSYHVALNVAVRYPNDEKLAQVRVPVVGSADLRSVLPNVTVRQHLCSSPAFASQPEVEAAAAEILKLLDSQTAMNAIP